MTLPSQFPLQEAIARFDYKLDNGNGRVADGLHNEYQRLLLNTRERERERKRFRGGENSASSANEDDMDVMGLDPGELASGEIRPPKRRLVAPNGLPLGQMMAPVVAEPRTPNAMQSPTQTPVSDVDEVVPTLPLPSPSASPVQDTKMVMEVESNVAIPTTQSELVEQLTMLLGFLNERNQNNLVFRLLQNTHRSLLSTFALLIEKLLKRDLLSNLPPEITTHILGYLDYQALLLIQQVCKGWGKIINNSRVWTALLLRDKLITDPLEIESELDNPDLVREWSNYPYEMSTAQVLYKKRCLIYNRWMNPNYQPRCISVKGYGHKVVTCLQHDDEKIVTGIDDKVINVYSTKTGKLTQVLEGHDGGVWALKYIGNTLVTGSTDRTARVWNLRTGKCTHIFRGHTLTIRCLDIIEPTVVGKDERGEDIIFPHFPILVTGLRDMNIHVWRLPVCDDSDDQTTHTYDSHDSHNPYLLLVLTGHTQLVRLVSGHGNIIVLGSYDLTVRVWDLMKNGQCTKVLNGHTEQVYSTALDFENRLCYSGLMDNTINVWNFDTGRHLKTLEGHQQLVGLLNLVDRVLVLAAADSTLIVWNPKTLQMDGRLKGHNLAITCFEHDGLKVVSGLQHMLKLWDVKTCQFTRDLLHEGIKNIWQVRIDYKRCVTAVQRGSVHEDDTQLQTYIEILDFAEPLFPVTKEATVQELL